MCRLRSGLPPFEHLEYFTSGAAGLIDCTDRLLRGNGTDARWMQVIGDYGAGKSHSLSLVREIAQRRHYATCHLSGDGTSSALNHPQRFISALLATLEIPGSPIYGYEDFLYDVFRDPARAEALSQIVHLKLYGTHSVAAQLRGHLAQLLHLLKSRDLEDSSQSGPTAFHTWSAIRHLSGQSIRHRSGTPIMRQFAYELLEIAAELVVTFGSEGLVLLIDEVESVYTKLPNVRSRHGAHRVLAALCESTSLKRCRIVLAITPDACCRFHTDIPLILELTSDLSCEPVERWAERLTADLGITVACNRLDYRARKDLLVRIREFYLSTYPQTRERLRQDFWERFVAELLPRTVPLRVLVRWSVDFLDLQRYTTR